MLKSLQRCEILKTAAKYYGIEIGLNTNILSDIQVNNILVFLFSDSKKDSDIDQINTPLARIESICDETGFNKEELIQWKEASNQWLGK